MRVTANASHDGPISVPVEGMTTDAVTWCIHARPAGSR